MNKEIRNIYIKLDKLAYYHKRGLTTNREFARLWDNYWRLLPNPFLKGGESKL